MPYAKTTGTVPVALGRLGSLKVLRLTDNLFTGEFGAVRLISERGLCVLLMICAIPSPSNVQIVKKNTLGDDSPGTAFSGEQPHNVPATIESSHGVNCSVTWRCFCSGCGVRRPREDSPPACSNSSTVYESNAVFPDLCSTCPTLPLSVTLNPRQQQDRPSLGTAPHL